MHDTLSNDIEVVFPTIRRAYAYDSIIYRNTLDRASATALWRCDDDH